MAVSNGHNHYPEQFTPTVHAAFMITTTRLGDYISHPTSAKYSTAGTTGRIELYSRHFELAKRGPLSPGEIGGLTVGLLVGFWCLAILVFLCRRAGYDSGEYSTSAQVPPPYSPPQPVGYGIHRERPEARQHPAVEENTGAKPRTKEHPRSLPIPAVLSSGGSAIYKDSKGRIGMVKLARKRVPLEPLRRQPIPGIEEVDS